MRLKATITQIDASRLQREWEGLREHIAAEQSEFVLLPEMCFAPWFCSARARDDTVWRAAVSAHDNWLARLPELGVKTVVGTAPREESGKRYNVAYAWTAESGIQWLRRKTYLPNDDGYWEANWYDRAPIEFPSASLGKLTLGVVICTEIWFMRHARDYGAEGAHLLLNPRSTPAHTNDKWLAGGRTAAVIAGAFCLSSNHAGRVADLQLGGLGWICDADGAVLATTAASEPFVTLELNLAEADLAKSTYPRYVDDSPL